MLTTLHLEKVNGIQMLALKSPKLREVKIQNSSHLRLNLVHGESVERLLIDFWEYTDVTKLKNLRYLYAYQLPREDSTFLSRLQQLKEIHANDFRNVPKLFEQKQRSGLVDLKIYLFGLLLNGPDDPTINALRGSSGYLSGESIVFLSENRSRLADEIPFDSFLRYSAIEGVPLGLDVDLLKRFTDLNEVRVDCPVEDIERFLDLLKNCKNIVELLFECDQLQDLFDRLPEHSAVQWLIIYNEPSDLDFLFRLKYLIHLNVHWTIDTETIRRAFEKLPLLSWLRFKYDQKRVSIEVDQRKQFQVSVDGLKKTVSDLNAAIEFIFGNERPEKCKADALVI